MKSIVSFTLTFVFLLFGSLSLNAAAPGPMKAAVPQAKEAVKTKKQAKRQARMEKRMEKFSKLIEKKLAKKGVTLKPGEKNLDIDGNLRLALIFFIIALVASAASVFIPFMWFLSYLAWLAAVIFFVLWLIEYLE